MVATKYYNKFQVISTREDYPLNKKYKRIKEMCIDLRDSPLNIHARSSIYNIIHKIGKLYKYHQIEIIQIKEPIDIIRNEILSNIIINAV